MSYNTFAYLYDRLMEDAPYDQWYEFSNTQIKNLYPQARKILDVGCGTGELMIRYLEAGYEVTGVDLSADMLTVANEKITNAGYSCSLFEQDMRSLEGLGSFDVVTVFCDSLNYLVTEEDVKQAFQQFYQVLNEGGLLLLDVHSIYKMNHIFRDATFAEDVGDIAYIWNVFEGEYPNSVEHELTFFVEEENGYFAKHEENHIQRTFSIDVYEQWLQEVGFSVLKVSGDFEEDSLEEAERILLVLRRN